MTEKLGGEGIEAYCWGEVQYAPMLQFCSFHTFMNVMCHQMS